ncbi:hypothetical protein CmeUKMEL1_09475 [Cryptosporidium meleagridis]|uniref:Uncharacterized protein n=1 Tax=Cryptosporidium meleagridis TaxID=93969 RepID=A0A2P4Z198_9CRYT|nr:hypothetical protein CmeUKMEL1_09475 [Cryptosporidium meleagridis]
MGVGGINGREESSSGFPLTGRHGLLQGRSSRGGTRSRGGPRCSRALHQSLQTIIESSETDSPDGGSNTESRSASSFLGLGCGSRPGSARGPAPRLFTRSAPVFPSRSPYSGVLLTSSSSRASNASGGMGQRPLSSRSRGTETRSSQSDEGRKSLGPGYGLRPGPGYGPTPRLFTRTIPVFPPRRPYSGVLLTSSSSRPSSASGKLNQKSSSSYSTGSGAQGSQVTSSSRSSGFGVSSALKSETGNSPGHSVPFEGVSQSLQGRTYFGSNCPRGIPGEHRVDITRGGFLMCCYCYNRCEHQGIPPPRRTTTTTTTQSPSHSSRGYLTLNCPFGTPDEHRLAVGPDNQLRCATCNNWLCHEGCRPPRLPRLRK